jgi:hypothetical protein
LLACSVTASAQSTCPWAVDLVTAGYHSKRELRAGDRIVVVSGGMGRLSALYDPKYTRVQFERGGTRGDLPIDSGAIPDHLPHYSLPSEDGRLLLFSSSANLPPLVAEQWFGKNPGYVWSKLLDDIPRRTDQGGDVPVPGGSITYCFIGLRVMK